MNLLCQSYGMLSDLFFKWIELVASKEEEDPARD